MNTSEPNRLAESNSPYLLQHQYNPVHWWEWGDDAFEEARTSDRPIFLSIGYSTCHWCHVMAHESFESQQVADILNDLFVNIKVDREERPDIDQIYMTSAQLMGVRGGWPLTIVMTPSKQPFFAATYIPPTSRHGRTGMVDLLPRIAEVWDKQRPEVEKSASAVTASLKKYADVGDAHVEGASVHGIIASARKQLLDSFDATHGGFGSAPKFPQPANLLLLLRQWSNDRDADTLRVVTTTLDKMGSGGLFDHVGFGFHRYSTDREWKLPHFEKMLYDQALLMLAYTEGFAATGKSRYKQTVKCIASYVCRELTGENGTFLSAEDADSEGEEGIFYVWSYDELKERLDPQDFSFIELHFGIKPGGNYADEASGHPSGLNIFHSADLQLDADELSWWVRISRILHQAREQRIRPSRDDKVLTDWNGLMIGALAAAGRTLADKKMLAKAEMAVEFFLNRFQKGTMAHAERRGSVLSGAMLDDFAFLAFGALELYLAVGKSYYLQAALELTGAQVDKFWSDTLGGFVQSDHDDLLLSSVRWEDGAIPSGNSMSYWNLIRLMNLTGNSELFRKQREALEKSIANRANQYQLGFVSYLLGAWHKDFAAEVVITGPEDATSIDALTEFVRRTYQPNVIWHRLTSQNKDELSAIAPVLATYDPNVGQAMVCTDYSCLAPVQDLERFTSQLNDSRGT